MSENTFKIRNAVADDIGEMVFMCKRTLAATYGSFLSEQTMRPWIEGDEAEKFITGRIDQTMLAMEGDRIAGLITVVDAMIELVWVDVEDRGKGYGKALMVAGERIMFKRGFERGRLECFSQNINAIRFYTSQGWRVVEKGMDEMTGVEKVVMEKALVSGGSSDAAPPR